MELESIFIDILLPKTKPIFLGEVYRPPKQTNFYDILESVLLSCSSFNTHESIVLGDFNTKFHKFAKNCQLLNSLKPLCSLFSLTHLIHAHTRISLETSSIIDLILVSDSHNMSQSGAINCCISDHQMIFCTRKVSRQSVGKHNTTDLRSLKNYDKDAFQRNLIGSDWNNVLPSVDVISAWDNFKSILMSAVESVAPMRCVRMKQRTEPWMDSDVLQSIKDRDKAFYAYKQDKTAENLSAFRELRNRA